MAEEVHPMLDISRAALQYSATVKPTAAALGNLLK
jgi:hypothetical protein